MSTDINTEIRRRTVIDHYENPRKKTKDASKLKGYFSGHNDSPSCIDNIDAYIKVDAKGIVEDVKFGGIGCAICTSSTDIMALALVGKNVKKAKDIIENYFNMIFEKPYDATKLGSLVFYDNISKHANRVKCALTGVQAISKALENYEKK